MVTKEFKLGQDTTVELKRPNFREFARVAGKVKDLLDLPPEKMLASSMFEEVLRACIHTINGEETRSKPLPIQVNQKGEEYRNGKADALDTFLEEADYQEPVKLFHEVVEFGEIPSFLDKLSKEHEKRMEEQETQEIRRMLRQVEIMKREGALPSEWSLESEMSKEMLKGANPTQSLESLTSTQPTTGGQGGRSKKRTTG